MADSALEAYQHTVTDPGPSWLMFVNQWSLAPSLARLGELYEARRDREKALESYGRLVEQWKDADPALQGRVREIKSRMARLSAEPKQ